MSRLEEQTLAPESLDLAHANLQPQLFLRQLSALKRASSENCLRRQFLVALGADNDPLELWSLCQGIGAVQYSWDRTNQR